MSIKKGQLYTGKVTDYRYPDQGKVVLDGTPVWIKGALPGQEVGFYISRKRPGACKGRLETVISKADYELEAADCPYFGQCGGCSYRNITYEEQLDIKAEVVRKVLEKGWQGEIPFEGISASPCQYGYRNKMEFSFGDEYKGGPLTLGLHKKGSFHDILNIRSCRIVHPDFDIIRNGVRDYFAEFYDQGKIDFHHKNDHKGYLRHLLIRRSASTGELLAALVTASPSGDEDDLIPGFAEMLKSLTLEGHIAGAFHIYNDSLSDVVKSDRTELLFGQDYITEEILGLKFKISLFSFFQTNSKGAEVLYSLVRDMAGSSVCHSERVTAYSEAPVIPSAVEGSSPRPATPVIYDLYCGTGTITQMMSPAADKVIGVEIIEEAVEAARQNAELNAINNIEFIAGDVMKVLCGEIGEHLPRPDMIILDPPREGIHPKALQKILNYAVQNIIYISCKASSLAEELQVFKAGGYDLVRVAAVDLFPDTVHVETIVLLSRKAD